MEDPNSRVSKDNSRKIAQKITLDRKLNKLARLIRATNGDIKQKHIGKFEKIAFKHLGYTGKNLINLI